MPLTLLAVCAIKITTIIHYSLNHVHVYFHGNDQFLEIILFPEKLYDLVNFNDAIIQVPKSYCYPDAYLILFRRWCYFQFYVYVYEVMLVCCSYDQWLMIIMSYYHFMHTYSWWKRRSWLWKEDHDFEKKIMTLKRRSWLWKDDHDFEQMFMTLKRYHDFEQMIVTLKRRSCLWKDDHDFEKKIMTLKRRSWFWKDNHDFEKKIMTLKRWSWLWTDVHDFEKMIMTLNRWSWLWKDNHK
jgi:hypothetical protein